MKVLSYDCNCNYDYDIFFMIVDIIKVKIWIIDIMIVKFDFVRIKYNKNYIIISDLYYFILIFLI